MDRAKLADSRKWIQAELDRCVRFWLDNGMDPVNGGVYTCLDRDGKPTEPPCKGSTFKGPFHLPRMLTMVDVMMGELLGE